VPDQFDDIVAGLQADTRRRRRRRTGLWLGVALCAVAAVLVAIGGPKGAVLAVIPWLIGMFLVVRARG
jgi:hypothetical protein